MSSCYVVPSLNYDELLKVARGKESNFALVEGADLKMDCAGEQSQACPWDSVTI